MAFNLAAAASSAAVPAVMTGVALAADNKIELPQWMALKLPGVGEVKLPNPPKLPPLPNVSLPKNLSIPNIPLPRVGSKSKGEEGQRAKGRREEKGAATAEKPKAKGKSDAVYVDENPNQSYGTASKPKPKVRASQSTKKNVNTAAPTFEELQKSKGMKATQVQVNEEALESYQSFPVRRLPGKNMQSFLDMAKDV